MKKLSIAILAILSVVGCRGRSSAGGLPVDSLSSREVQIINISELEASMILITLFSKNSTKGVIVVTKSPTLMRFWMIARTLKNAIGRIARVKIPFNYYEQDIKVIYDKDGNIVRTSLQTDLMIEHIWDYWREWKRGDDFMLWRGHYYNLRSLVSTK